MKIVECGNIFDTGCVDCYGAPIKAPGIIITATSEEIKALPFNPIFAEVEIVKKEPENKEQKE